MGFIENLVTHFRSSFGRRFIHSMVHVVLREDLKELTLVNSKIQNSQES